MRKIKSYLLGCAVVFLLLLWSCGRSGEITLLSYNVENLFDDVDNGNEYREYDPSSPQWNRELMEVKLTNIAGVIRQAVPGGPDIVCLQEVENQHVLDLLATEYLADLHYRFTYVAVSGETPTHVALLSRLPVLRTHLHRVPDWNGQALRSILEFEVSFENVVLHVFNNHWKSKTGGAGPSEAARLRTAGVLIARLKALEKAYPHADIIVVGDMNESYDEYRQVKGAYQTALMPADTVVPEAFYTHSLFLTPDPHNAGFHDGKTIFYECWYSLAPDQRGSYVYQKQWQTLDHILLSAGLFDKAVFSVVRMPFLLDARTGYPLRWKAKARNKGYSDHLPLLLRLDITESP